jgi:hypothetical protein
VNVDGDDSTDTSIVPRSYPPADITPAEFEEYVSELFGSAATADLHLRVRLHERIPGLKGSYDFDATARFTWAGLEFLVVIEAKRHANPIERSTVQVLQTKMEDVGAHKAVIVSTSPPQRGALEWASKSGIAIVTVTEGRFTYETRTRGQSEPFSRAEARELLGLPDFVGHSYESGATPGSVVVTLVSKDRPGYIRESLLGVPEAGGAER